MEAQVLTPNQQLFIIFALFVIFSTLVGVLFFVIVHKIKTIERKFGPITPFWKHVLRQLSSIMTHPHEWARELDDLLAEANLEPEVHMDDDRFKRLLTLLAERAVSTQPDLRVDEKEAAVLYLLALPFARTEGKKLIELTGVRLVGTQAPADQTDADASKEQDV